MKLKASAEAPRTFWSEQRVAGFALGGVGLGAGIAGFVFGGLALGAKGEAESVENCNADKVCAPQGTDAIDRAEVFAHASTGLLVGGGVLAATGLVLILTASDGVSTDAELERRARLGPGIALAPHAASDVGLGLEVAW